MLFLSNEHAKKKNTHTHPRTVNKTYRSTVPTKGTPFGILAQTDTLRSANV